MKRFVGKLKSWCGLDKAKPKKPELERPRETHWIPGSKPTRTPSSIHEINERRRKTKLKEKRRKANKQARACRRRNRGVRS